MNWISKKRMKFIHRKKNNVLFSSWIKIIIQFEWITCSFPMEILIKYFRKGFHLNSFVSVTFVEPQLWNFPYLQHSGYWNGIKNGFDCFLLFYSMIWYASWLECYHKSFNFIHCVEWKPYQSGEMKTNEYVIAQITIHCFWS